jgi:glycosyltransferase involved in cell wall biosynthesis
MGIRDSNDTILNRLTLRIQYRLADHLFAHTEKMKQELVESFGVQGERVTIIPFGINNSVPNTALTPREARLRLGIGEDEKTILFFGNIARYKGIDYLVDAFKRISQRSEHHRLIIAGRPKNCEEYWTEVREMISADVQRGRVILREDYIPDIEIEIYFKAADVLVLPYRHIYQSGVLFLGYSFGLPVIATDVGSIRDEVVEGETGYLCRPNDPVHLAEVIERYFASDLYDNLHTMRSQIRSYAERQHSWEIVGQATLDVYAEMLGSRVRAEMQGPEASRNSLDVKRPF